MTALLTTPGDIWSVDMTGVGDGICRTILAYRNITESAIISGADEQALYPFSNSFDHSYNTEYAPADATTVTIVCSLAAASKINYISLISKNGEDSGLSLELEGLMVSSGIYEPICEISSFKNGIPSMVYFGDEHPGRFANVLAVRITLTYTSTPYIMTMFCGNAIVFPRTLSLGAQPGHLSNIDEVEIFYADEGLNIAPSRRLARGYQLKGSINYVKMTTIEQFWREYSNHVKDVKTLFLMWNDKLPEQVIYGVQIPDRLTKPAYKTSLFSQIEFDVVGWA